MFLLGTSTENLMAIATWGSFIVAIVSTMLAWVSMFQTKKIKELSEVVTELQNHSVIMQKRLDIEKIVSLKEIMPVFIIDHINVSEEQNSVTIFIKNVGTNFQFLNTGNSTPNINRFQNQNTEGKSGEIPRICVFFNSNETLANYEFDIITMSESGYEFTQRFKQIHNNRPRIEPPVL